MALLEMTGVGAHYGRIQALHEISLTVNEGEVVTLIGANGAGKTTTMRVVSGLRPLSSGSITFDGDDISALRADLRVVRGISQAPEGRGIFPGMTVMENLDMGGLHTPGPQGAARGVRPGLRALPAARRAPLPGRRNPVRW